MKEEEKMEEEEEEDGCSIVICNSVWRVLGEGRRGGGWSCPSFQHRPVSLPTVSEQCLWNGG